MFLKMWGIKKKCSAYYCDYAQFMTLKSCHKSFSWMLNLYPREITAFTQKKVLFEKKKKLKLTI